MPIPSLVATINDGALGLTPGTADNTHLVLGACTLGTVNTQYSASDLKTLQANNGIGPAVEAAAHTLAIAGGPVIVVPINTSVVGVSPTLVQAGTGTALVTAPQVAGVISSGTTPPAITITGTPTQATPAGVYGITIPLGGAVATATFTWTINGVVQGTAILTASTVALGTTGLTANFSAGTFFVNNIYNFGVTVPNDQYEVIAKIVAGGASGSQTYQVALDSSNPGVPTYSATLTGPAVTSPFYLVPGTGITLAFSVAGTFVAGDTFAGLTGAPGYSATDVNNALIAILATPTDFAFIHLVGQAANSAAAAAMTAVLDTQMTSAANAYRYCFAVQELPADTDSNIVAAFASTVSLRVAACASFESLASAVTGRVQSRPSAWVIADRTSLVPVGRDISAVADGACPGVVKLARDEAATPALDAARISTLRTHVGFPGFFICNGQMLSPIGSDFRYIHLRRVMDKASKVARIALMAFLNSGVRVNANGTIYENDARNIEATVNSALASALVQPVQASSVSTVVSRTQNILSTQTLAVTIRVTPLGYAKQITLDIGYQNPNVVQKLGEHHGRPHPVPAGQWHSLRLVLYRDLAHRIESLGRHADPRHQRGFVQEHARARRGVRHLRADPRPHARAVQARGEHDTLQARIRRDHRVARRWVHGKGLRCTGPVQRHRGQRDHRQGHRRSNEDRGQFLLAGHRRSRGEGRPSRDGRNREWQETSDQHARRDRMIHGRRAAVLAGLNMPAMMA